MSLFFCMLHAVDPQIYCIFLGKENVQKNCGIVAIVSTTGDSVPEACGCGMAPFWGSLEKQNFLSIVNSVRFTP